jgi:hypothetical protein
MQYQRREMVRRHLKKARKAKEKLAQTKSGAKGK